MGSDSAGLSGAFDLAAWFAWFGELDRALAFLLVLPLVVAAVGLWAHLREREEERGEGDGRRDGVRGG
jgi:membrane protein implicated in regulation of membrane protease activity